MDRSMDHNLQPLFENHYKLFFTIELYDITYIFENLDFHMTLKMVR